MKRTLSILIALLLCLSIFVECKNFNADTDLPPFDPPTSEGVSSVRVSSLPEGYNYSFTGEIAKKVVDYFSEVQLTSKYDDNPNEMSGMTFVVSITYQDGRTETLYEFSPFIRKDGGSWYKIVQNDVTNFHTFLNELKNEYDEIPNDPDSFKTLYTVEITNSENYPILNGLKASYRMGEKVTIELETITEHYYVLYVNGVEQSPDETGTNDWSVTCYTFSMPAENVIITIEDRWVDIPENSQGTGQQEECEHNWQVTSQTSDCWSITVNYACSKCGMEKFTHEDSALPYHSWAEKTDEGKTTFSCIRCNESYTFLSEIRTFSYAQALEEYKIGDPGVKHEHFNNWNVESEITGAIDAIVRAKFELTIEYDTISVSYDKTSNMWRVDFWTLDLDGNSQSVYINGNGLTCYIVYGE